MTIYCSFVSKMRHDKCGNECDVHIDIDYRHRKLIKVMLHRLDLYIHKQMPKSTSLQFYGCEAHTITTATHHELENSKRERERMLF